MSLRFWDAVNAARILLQMLHKMCSKCCTNYAVNVAKNGSFVAGFPATVGGFPATRAANGARIVL